MKIEEAIKGIAREQGARQSDISEGIGRNKNFAAAVLNRDNMTVKTAQAFLDYLGWELVLKERGSGKEINLSTGKSDVVIDTTSTTTEEKPEIIGTPIGW